jgi:hypothetical protein
MLAIINDPDADQSRRDRMIIAALPIGTPDHREETGQTGCEGRRRRLLKGDSWGEDAMFDGRAIDYCPSALFVALEIQIRSSSLACFQRRRRDTSGMPPHERRKPAGWRLRMESLPAQERRRLFIANLFELGQSQQTEARI